ncbi:exosortase-associated protein EpsI, V-type [Rhodoblastus sp.]|uniref:exosortase-associated protein EpsI, V-type n=1 Tax=Rhodoblastus sp. TaxID=1962975 RepID=UPI003F99F2B4
MSARRLNISIAIVVILAATAAAHALIPRRLLAERVSQSQLEAMIPKTLPGWTAVPDVRIVEPQGSDTLSREIYNAELARGYSDADGHLVMLVVAYGASQSDRLQLHRPEICYAAQGFRVTASKGGAVALGDGAANLPVHVLVAQREGRIEPIIYWMRIGDKVAINNIERQLLKVRYGLQGYVTDGVLVRISTIGLSPDAAFRLEQGFSKSLLNSVSPTARRFLVGTSVSPGRSG